MTNLPIPSPEQESLMRKWNEYPPAGQMLADLDRYGDRLSLGAFKIAHGKVAQRLDPDNIVEQIVTGSLPDGTKFIQTKSSGQLVEGLTTLVKEVGGKHFIETTVNQYGSLVEQAGVEIDSYTTRPASQAQPHQLVIPTTPQPLRRRETLSSDLQYKLDHRNDAFGSLLMEPIDIDKALAYARKNGETGKVNGTRITRDELECLSQDGDVFWRKKTGLPPVDRSEQQRQAIINEQLLKEKADRFWAKSGRRYLLREAYLDAAEHRGLNRNEISLDDWIFLQEDRKDQELRQRRREEAAKNPPRGLKNLSYQEIVKYVNSFQLPWEVQKPVPEGRRLRSIDDI